MKLLRLIGTHSLPERFARVDRWTRVLAVVAPLILANCANRATHLPENGPPHPQAASPRIIPRADPLEAANRRLWQLNYSLLDPLLFRPMAVIWHRCMPPPLRQGIGNVLSNMDEVPTAINELLQAQFAQALRQAARFAINTLGGLGGLVDIASYSGLPKQKPHYSLGHVLGYYHVGPGPYLVLPVYGPTTPRQLLGRISEQVYYFPLSCLTLWGHLGKGIIEGLERRAQLLSREVILQQSSDSYLTVREAYFQRHDFVVEEQRGGQGEGADQEPSQDPLEQLD